jgi:hypothetical protein
MKPERDWGTRAVVSARTRCHRLAVPVVGLSSSALVIPSATSAATPHVVAEVVRP